MGGTLPYMAPEHLDAFNPRGTTPPEAVDERADIYALALILFEMLAGHHPFEPPEVGRPLLDVLAAMTEEGGRRRRRSGPGTRASPPGSTRSSGRPSTPTPPSATPGPATSPRTSAATSTTSR